MENFQKLFLKFDFEFWIWSLCITCIKNYITFTQKPLNCDQERRHGFLSVEAGPKPGPTKPNPKITNPRIWSTIISEGPIFHLHFWIPVKMWEDRKFLGPPHTFPDWGGRPTPHPGLYGGHAHACGTVVIVIQAVSQVKGFQGVNCLFFYLEVKVTYLVTSHNAKRPNKKIENHNIQNSKWWLAAILNNNKNDEIN